MESSTDCNGNGQHMFGNPEQDTSPEDELEKIAYLQSTENTGCSNESQTHSTMSDDSAVATSDSGDDITEEKDEIAKLLTKIDQQCKIIETQRRELNNYERECVNISRDKLQLEQQFEEVKKQKFSAVKDKELTVMRYAVSEKNIIDLKLGKTASEKKNHDLKKECDLLQSKLKTMESEKSRICGMLDNKCYELKSSSQDNDRLKADLNSLETKLKWSQHNLKTEIELRKDSEAKVELLASKIQESMDNVDKARKEAAECIKEFQTSQENKAFVLERESKELHARLILLRHERDDIDHQRRTAAAELARVQQLHEAALRENNQLSMRVLQLEGERSELEQRHSELRAWADQQRRAQADVTAARVGLERAELLLKSEQEQLVAANEQIALLKERNSDIESEIESCRQREAELLVFTQQLTEKNVKLQSEFTSMDTRIQQLTCEQVVFKRAAKEHEAKATVLASELIEEKTRFTQEVGRLNKALDEKTATSEKLSQELADQLGENGVIKRKFDLSLREINKELGQCRKRIEQYENAGLASSSSSNTSLNAMERISNGETERDHSPEQVKVVQPERAADRQVLIEHIVKLQRVSARKSEKLDFLEEHVNTLVSELQRKTRLLQTYILREQAGTLSSNKMDNNKAILARHGGVMASMYAAKISDPSITLELSLDINRKLQAVLEDALLKNIMLKENVDTLGKEIDRLNSRLDLK